MEWPRQTLVQLGLQMSSHVGSTSILCAALIYLTIQIRGLSELLQEVP